jgi:serine/threonine protein phosphatase PrpC
MKFTVFQVSRKGGRKKNEDRMGYCYTRGAAIFLLADGLGGHPDGEVAAQLALQTITGLFEKEATPELPDVAAFLIRAVMAAHRQIVHYGMSRAMLDSPRTTIVVAVIQSGVISWTHCGDSRLYLLRDGHLMMRTRDHSSVEQELAKAPVLKSGRETNRNVLVTCLGSSTRPVFKLDGAVTLQQGDRVMLCSDGLWATVAEQDIVAQLVSNPVDAAVPVLVEKALRLGGPTGDNVTCLALEWETPDAFAATRGSISTDSINAGVFASTVQSGWFDAPTEELDDAAIERSIAEINAAIRRSAK